VTDKTTDLSVRTKVVGNSTVVLQDRQCTYNVTLWRVHVTIVAVETQQFIVCVLLRIVTVDNTK